MTAERARAVEPDELARFFVERANAGDLAGLVELYSEDATLAAPDGTVARGRKEVMAVYARFLAGGPLLEPGEQRPALVSGRLALTSTRLRDGSVTAEVARREPDGSWRWVVDQPRIA
jgi:ketosteroid isomerase-like protein